VDPRAGLDDVDKRNFLTLRRWVDNIKMDLRETGWGDVDWIDLAQDRDQWRALVNAVMNEPSGSIKCWEFLE
jgi:hypothetical protein